MYEGLLLSTGGGIITDPKKSAQQGETTIIIGLGGTGIDALKVVKRKVYEQLIPDNPNDEIPEYENIGFLAIDTDYIDTGSNGDGFHYLKNDECLAIGVPNLNAKMEADIERKQAEFAWLQPELNLLGVPGAGTVRQVGRYCLFKNIDQIIAKISDLRAAVTKRTSNNKVNVHILAGISGGTGSGIFIDMCYIIRDLLGRDATLFGYFFMPDVNLNKAEIAGDPLIMNRIKSNGYAALKELDYTMSLNESGDSFSQYYGGVRLYSIEKTSEPPVDLCHLISSTDKNGVHISNGYMYSMNVVGEYILSYLAQVQGNHGAGMHALEHHLVPKPHLIDMIEKKHGANLKYHILGASTAELPTKEIGTYLAARLYEKIGAGLTENRPNDHAVSEHADAMGLSLNTFRRKLYGEGDYQIYDARAIRWQGADDFSIEDILNTQIIVDDRADETNIVMTDKILRPARLWRVDNEGVLEENFRKLTRDLDDFNLIGRGKRSTNLISTVFQYLQNEIITDFNYGAIYASKLTHNPQGQTLNDRLSGIVEHAKTVKKHCEYDRDLRVRDIFEAAKFCREKCTGIFVTKKKQEEGIRRYKSAIRAYYQNEFDIKVYQKIQEMADILKAQIDKEGYPNSLYPKYFKPMESMLTELKTTFESNLAFLNNPAPVDDEFAWKMVSFDGIKGNVDEQFNKQISNVPVIYRNFIEKIMEQYDKWTDGDRRKVGKMITSYISDVFRPVLSASMDSYLNDKYGTHGNPQALQGKIKTDLLENGVLAKAEPIFHINGKYTMATAQKGDLSVPAVEPNVCIAAQSIAAMKPLAVRYTGLSDRISAVKFESGIPLYAYGLIEELEKQYNSGGQGVLGRHLYEITDRNKNINWAALPSVIPYSINPQSNWGGEEIEQLYYEAESRGIIAEHPHGGGNYCVYELETPELKGRYDFTNGNEFQEYMKMLNSYKDNTGRVSSDAPMRKVHMLCNDGAGGYYDLDYRQICRIDYFIRFKNLQAAARNSMEVLDRVEKALEEANNWIEEAKNN